MKIYKLTEELNKPMYLVMTVGGGDQGIYYVGYDLAEAENVVDEMMPHWVEFGLGGGDTLPCVVKYDGDQKVFASIASRYNSNTNSGDPMYDELGSLDDLEIIYEPDECMYEESMY